MDHQEINQIKEQFNGGLWPQFLERVKIDKLRGWKGESVEFKFPITAIVGENGTGKSTLLKSAACAYNNDDQTKRFDPSDFFLKTYWDNIEGVELDFKIKRGQNTSDYRITKPTVRWRKQTSQPKRDVFLLDISRTLPIDAAVGYARVAKLTSNEVLSSDLTSQFREKLSHVLGKSYDAARFAVSDADNRGKKVGVLGINGAEISQYHQGAGEDATLDTFLILEGIPPNSLLIIDEVEASLHPKAQRRLTRFLLWLCRIKRLQIILSTHSPYVLNELPREARILLLPSSTGISAVQGVSTELAMSAIDDEVHAELDIFVEDREAEIWLREILVSRAENAHLIQRIETYPVGAANVVTTMGQLAGADKLPRKGLGMIDGDHKNSHCSYLPGDIAPERKVYSDLKELNWSELTERFGVGAGTLHTVLDDAMREPNHHDWNTFVGDRIRKSSISVWEVMVNEWCSKCLQDEERDRIIQDILNAINK